VNNPQRQWILAVEENRFHYFDKSPVFLIYALLLIVLAHFCRNIASGHFIDRFNTVDPPAQVFLFETFL
jgi:hypothetical protein